MARNGHQLVNDTEVIGTSRDWSVLRRCDDPQQARMIRTCLSAMGFETRLVVNGNILDNAGDAPLSSSPVVEVPESSWADLNDVLDELLEEQASFDENIRQRNRNHRRLGRWLFLGFILIVIFMAVFRIIEL